MGRRRRRSRGGGISRRRFLAGGLLGIGGASILGGTQAFSQVDATRAAAIQTAADENALLGLDVTTSVVAGSEDQQLVDVTNNTSEPLDLSVSLQNPDQGAIHVPTAPFSSGDSTSVTVTVDEYSQTGEAALPFDISATGDAAIGISMTRAVAVTPPAPALKHYIQDNRTDGAVYQVSFEVLHLDSFDRIEVTFDNLDKGWATNTETAYSPEGTVDYSEDGTNNDQYQITLEVFDTSDTVVLSETVSDVADGTNPPDNDDLGSPDDPVLESFTLTDTSQYNPEITIDYEVSNTENFQRVEVDVINQDNSWATQTLTNPSPSDSVVYDTDGTMNDTIDVTVRAVNTNGATMSSGTLTHVVASGGTKDWPE